jgi:hypothetical protein
MRLLFASGWDAVHSLRSPASSPALGPAPVGAGAASIGARARLAVQRLDALGATLSPRLLVATGIAAVTALIPLTAHYSAACAGKYAAAAVFIAVPLSLLFTPVRADRLRATGRGKV